MPLIPISATLSAKRILRQRVLARRDALSAGERTAASAKIRERLLTLPEFRNAKGVHGFVSFVEEVDTAPIMAECVAAGKSIYLPYITPARDRIGCALWGPEDSLVPGPFGTQEPPPESRGPVDLAAIDLVLMPGVAFDRYGGRLGYGKAYYDHFLAEVAALRGTMPTLVALAFSVQIVEAVPRNAWDVSIPQVITEWELIHAEIR
jgi:5-formyltetrahydrofolate cyclo-ligase